MIPQFPAPETTLVILLGASAWPRYPELEASSAFSNAAKDVITYFLDPQGFHLPQENFLNLFDSDEPNDILDENVNQFLSKHIRERKTERDSLVKDVLFYFIGHGYISEGNSDFHLAIRRTRQNNPGISSLSIRGLSKTLKEQARFQRRVIILDCCFAAAAVKFYQGAGLIDVIRMQTYEAFEEKIVGKGFPARGTTFICSSSSNTRSRFLPDGTSTMFTQAWLHALRTGYLPQEGKSLSLRVVHRLAVDFLLERHGNEVPKPEIHSPDQSEGDVAEVPLFPNHHARTKTASDKVQSRPGANVEQIIELTGSEATSGTTRILRVESREHCKTCQGTKQIQGKICITCRGQGIILGTQQIEAKIPAGVRNGTRIRIAGKGQYSVDSGERGDLFLIVKLQPEHHVGTNSESQKVIFPVAARQEKMKLLRTCKSHKHVVASVAWGPDGQTLVSGSRDETIKLWNAQTGKLLRTCKGHTYSISSVVWSPDGLTLASGSNDTTIKLWNAQTGKLLHTLTGHTRSVQSVAWKPDGLILASGSGDLTIKLWNAQTSQLLHTLTGHTNWIYSVAWKANGQALASGDGDCIINIWG